VLAQRVGPVIIDFETRRDDLSVVNVPEDCVGYVMGRQGAALRGMEEEWGTLMFFAKVAGSGDGNNGRGMERLAIFGTRRSRRGAELKVMSAVEHKHPGYFLTSEGQLRSPLKQPGDGEGDGWDYELVPLTSEEFSYALGAGGSTRKKLARAADCIMEYVGMVAVCAGYRDERRRARDYLGWLLEQRRGTVTMPDTKGRDDLTVIEVPRDSVGFITGYKGESLREIERQSGTFCFADGEKGRDTGTGAFEHLLIFGASSEGRKLAKRIVQDKIQDSQYRDRSRDAPGGGGGYGGRGGGGYGGGGGGGYGGGGGGFGGGGRGGPPGGGYGGGGYGGGGYGGGGGGRYDDRRDGRDDRRDDRRGRSRSPRRRSRSRSRGRY